MYISGHLEPTLRRVLGRPAPIPQEAAEAEAAANRIVLGTEPPADRIERMLWEALHG